MIKLMDLTGNTFGSLTAISFHGIKKRRRKWNCICICGKHHIVDAGHLRSGKVKSCGCSKLRGTTTTHGESSVKGRTKEYSTWRHIIQRCYDPNLKEFYRYGGKGITVCEKWLRSYESFLSDMGRAPSPKHSIERIKNDQGYSPDNCKWATPTEQANNRSSSKIITYKNETMTLAQWCRKLNLPYRRIRQRLGRNKWSIERAFSS